MVGDLVKVSYCFLLEDNANLLDLNSAEQVKVKGKP